MTSAPPETVLEFHPEDVFIVVTGITGHGKSSFISKCCEGFENIVGHSLQSHTQKCTIYSFVHDGKSIRLVDTPGFDDSKRTGTEILREIAEWLLWGYSQGAKLSGIVYLHSIQENRMKGSGITNLEMFKRITGIQNMNQVVLATTMWDITRKEDAEKRERELMETEEFWGPLIMEHKSMPARFLNNKVSALGIVDKITKLNPFVPSLQHEMAVENRDLNETSAGRTLNKEIIEAQEKSAREMKDMEEQLQQALNDKDIKYAQQVMNMQENLNKQMEQLAQNQKDMQVKSEELLSKKEEEIRKAREEMAEMKQKQQEQDKKHAEDVERMRAEGKKRDEEYAKKMTDLAKEHNENMENFKDQMVNDAVNVVGVVKDFYDLALGEQQKVTEDVKAKLKSQAAAPPPYSQVPPAQSGYYPPPQPMYYPPPPRQSYDDDIARTAGAGAGIALGTTALGAAALGVCILM